MTIASFEVDENVVQLFMHSPTISVDEALASPSKRRISLVGKVENVSSFLKNILKYMA